MAMTLARTRSAPALHARRYRRSARIELLRSPTYREVCIRPQGPFQWLRSRSPLP